MHYIGVEIHTNYSDSEGGSSGAKMFRARDFLEKHYSVSKDHAGARFNSEHIEKSRQYLKNSNPILISGNYTSTNGHAWVLDGYEYSSRIQNQIYRYYDQNNNLLYTQHLENPVGAFEFFHYNLGWGSSKTSYLPWLNVHAQMIFEGNTYDRDIELFYISK